ncbi:MAG: Rossman fold protein family [Verrucomicrobiaceae bacterium]|nr:Rossman fold protein family [Verrucomicrobiaceae bacterium]
MDIAVFCASSLGNDVRYVDAAKQLGSFLGASEIGLVYGDAKVGLMGVIADAVLEAGGKVYGVIPKSLKDREVAHPNLTELFVVADMHERKAKMASLADAFVALPGGAGTMEEIFEVWTWGQLGHHSKPCALYNVHGFYDRLLSMIETMTDTGFLKPDYAEMLITVDNPKDLIHRFKTYVAPAQKWSS